VRVFVLKVVNHCDKSSNIHDTLLLGALGTTAALVTAMVKMRRGEARSFNNWLRVRVVAQGLTICAIVLGTYSLGQRNAGIDPESGRTPVEADLERRREEKMDKEKREFEGRLKMAEDAHRAEVAGLSAVKGEPGSGGARERLEERMRAGAKSSPVEREPAGRSGGWRERLGWSKGSGSGDQSS
jgi:hypothetical protein